MSMHAIVRSFAPAIFTIGAVGVATLVSGCESSNVYETTNARPNAIDFQSRISNPFLKGRVDVTSCYVGETPDGLLRVQCNVQNKGGNNAQYMYMFTWFDSAGLKIGNNHDFWTRRELNAGASGEVPGLAPTKNAVDWRLEIRPWDK